MSTISDNSRGGQTARRLLYLAAALIVGLAAASRPGRGLLQELGDRLAPPATTAPTSRWYGLTELGIADVPGQLASAAAPAANLPGPEWVRGACPADLLWDRQVLHRSEGWERGIEERPDAPAYPSIVLNDRGEKPDGRFYLFYAIHDPYSGIGVAVADSLDGEFTKLADLEPKRIDSRVLRAPKRPRKTSHHSSPVVIWNPDEERWFMYFHYYVNEWESGGGHQRTGLAVSRSLASHDWSVWRDEEGRIISVLPTTEQRWMNSQSSYHSITRLPSGLWLAFVRGVGGEYDEAGQWQQDVAKLGFAVSRDGRRWALTSSVPSIHQQDGRHGRKGVYRPLFTIPLPQGVFLAWAESEYYDSDPKIRTGVTADLATVEPVPVPDSFKDWTFEDGPFSLIAQGDKLYAFYGARQRAWQKSDTCETD